MNAVSRLAALVLLAAVMLVAGDAHAQDAEAPAPADDGKPPMSQPELDQLLASIALYPDPLLAQMLMAATYPIEIVQADRWVKQNPDLKGDALAKALEEKPWDASVKSLVNFPDVLGMMSEELEWTVKLGDAFLGQQEQVMSTVQALRRRAKAQGNLKSTPQQTVTTQAAESGEAGAPTTIIIEPANPEVIYVPAYDPWVTYGAWWYPDYGPYYYPWPWFWGGAGISFGVGVAAGVPWGYAWGHPHWHHHHVDVDHRRHAHLNRHIRHSRYLGGTAATPGPRAWRHSPAHRAGMSYRNRATAQRFNAGWQGRPLRARETFRPQAEAGRRAIQRGAVDRRPMVDRRPTVDRTRAGGVRGGRIESSRGYWQPRPQSVAPGPRRSSVSAPAPRMHTMSAPSRTFQRGTTFRNADRGWAPTRASSQRGHSSRIHSIRAPSSSFRGIQRGGGTIRHAPTGGGFRSVRPSGGGGHRGGGAVRGGGGGFRGGGAVRGGGARGGGGRR